MQDRPHPRRPRVPVADPWTDALIHAFDDDDEPSELTLFPADRPGTTAWLTIDVDHAVDLADAV